LLLVIGGAAEDGGMREFQVRNGNVGPEMGNVYLRDQVVFSCPILLEMGNLLERPFVFHLRSDLF
jgi:hypothetical protein